MEMKGPQTAVDNKPKGEDISSYNLKWLLSTSMTIWPWLLASIIISLICANIYLRYTTPVYRSYAELLIIDSKKGNTSSGDDIMKMLNNNSTKNINIENEIKILGSRTTLAKVVKELHLNINYSIVGRFKTSSAYSNKPFEFVIADTTDEFYSCKIDILNNDSYRLTETRGSKVITARFGDTIAGTNFGKIVIQKTPYFNPSNIQYTINVVKVLDQARFYAGAIEISSPTKNASFISLSLNDNIPERSMDVINSLMKVYMTTNVDNRNRISDSTIKFINNRIETVFAELDSVESKIEKFKKDFNIADMSAQSEQLITANATTTEKLHIAEVELEVISSISKYLQNATDDKSIILPASLMNNSGLAGLMDKFNALQTAIDQSLISNREDNPVTKALIDQKKAVKQNIVSSLASSKLEVQIKVDKIKKELNVINGDIQKVPKVERKYLEFARVQAIKQDLYIFLLKKREETAITKASTVPDANIIDSAINIGQVLPNRSRILTLALLIGTIIPFAIILLRKALNIKIISKSDITRSTSIPIIGEIGNNLDGEAIAVTKNSRTIISEQFRALRTNLQYVLTDKNDKVLMITSSMSGEGKSFIAVNLSITLAMSGKKVVLMELDLRKPKISKTLNINNSVGFSNYVIGKAKLEEILIPSGIDPNLFILPSGPIPPNPAELIHLTSTEKLFQLLREKFDYIIIDTSPVGLVTDAQLINKYADTTLYILRQGHTYKQQLNIPNELHNSGKFSRVSFIVNDVLANRGFAYGYGYEEGYGYGYGYGYGAYGNGYYAEEEPRKGLKGLFKSKKK
jgi:tyrosine-protein kinase Etk/Wzc